MIETSHYYFYTALKPSQRIMSLSLDMITGTNGKGGSKWRWGHPLNSRSTIQVSNFKAEVCKDRSATAIADLVNGKTLSVDKCTTTTAPVQILELWFTSCFWDSKQSNY